MADWERSIERRPRERSDHAAAAVRTHGRSSRASRRPALLPCPRTATLNTRHSTRTFHSNNWREIVRTSDRSFFAGKDSNPDRKTERGVRSAFISHIRQTSVHSHQPLAEGDDRSMERFLRTIQRGREHKPHQISSAAQPTHRRHETEEFAHSSAPLLHQSQFLDDGAQVAATLTLWTKPLISRTGL